LADDSIIGLKNYFDVLQNQFIIGTAENVTNKILACPR
jgi:hypothetical protein